MDFQKQFEQNLENDYEITIISDEHTSNKKYNVKHLVCGREKEYKGPYALKREIPCYFCNKEHNWKAKNEEISQFLETNFPGQFALLSDYKGVTEKITLYHKECNTNTELLMPLKGKNLCQECRRQEKLKQKTAKFAAIIESETNGEYKMISDYTSFGHVTILHNECEDSFSVHLNDFINKGTRCPVCAGYCVQEKKFLEQVREKHGNDFQFLSKYTNKSNLIKAKHVPCGTIVTKKGSAFTSSVLPCGYCLNRFSGKADLERKIHSLFGDEYSVIGDYEKSTVETDFKHNLCGYIFPAKPSVLMSRKGYCPKCSGWRRTTEEAQMKVRELLGEEYEVIGEYTGVHKPFILKHHVCGQLLNTTYMKLQKHNHRCPCSHGRFSAQGQIKIRRLLSERPYITYETRYALEDCSYLYPLPFDFAVFKGNVLMGVIDFHDKKHFEPIEEIGGLETLLEIQKRDQIKEDFCLEQEIDYIKINHSETNNIHPILKHFLNKILN